MTVRASPLEGERLELKNISTYGIESLHVENNSVVLKTFDMPSAADAQDVVNTVFARIKCQFDDVVTTEIFPGPHVSYTYVFSTYVEPKFVDAYVERVRSSGLKATVRIGVPHNDRVYIYVRMGLFPDVRSTYERCNKIFLTSFRYTLHGDDVPSFDGGAKKLSECWYVTDPKLKVMEFE